MLTDADRQRQDAMILAMRRRGTRLADIVAALEAAGMPLGKSAVQARAAKLNDGAAKVRRFSLAALDLVNEDAAYEALLGLTTTYEGRQRLVWLGVALGMVASGVAEELAASKAPEPDDDAPEGEDGEP